jgi:hypothetical protein
MKVMTVPDAALRDSNSVEMARVWIAEEGLHCSLKIGMYLESSKVPEQEAWGMILADMTRHIADALCKAHGFEREASIAAISDSYFRELKAPTTEVRGDFSPGQQ